MASNSEMEEFDQIAQSIPDSLLDSRRYFWPNFDQPRYIHHQRKKFVYSICLPTPITESGSYYIATFGESLLLTWVGLETRVYRRIGASTSITVKIVHGSDPFSSEHTDLAAYSKVPPPVRLYEPREIHRRTIEEKIDIGFMVHERVHKDYGIELMTRCQNVSLHNTVVVVKVLSSALSGGSKDHPSWNQEDYINRKYPKHLSFLDCKKALHQ